MFLGSKFALPRPCPFVYTRQILIHPMRLFPLALFALTASALAQQAPYDVFPAAEAPYHRVRYEASTQPGELIFPVNYTIWLPPGV